MNKEVFREKVQVYCHDVAKSQKILAQAMGLHYSVLSNKLNGTKNATLVLYEVKSLIRTLAEWQAIHSQEQVLELLATLDLKLNCFTEQEWTSLPLQSVRNS